MNKRKIFATINISATDAMYVRWLLYCRSVNVIVDRTVVFVR